MYDAYSDFIVDSLHQAIQSLQTKQQDATEDSSLCKFLKVEIILSLEMEIKILNEKINQLLH